MQIGQVNTLPQRLFGNVTLSRPVIAIGATASAVSTTNAIVNAIDGIIRQTAALTNQALQALAAADLPSNLADWRQPSGLTGFYTQPANTTAYYVLVVNAAGNVRVVQGTWRNPTTGATQQITLPSGMSIGGDGAVPDIPDGVAPFALLRVALGATTFTPGTTNLNAANVTTTLWDLMALPSVRRP